MIKQELLSELFGVSDDLSARIIQNAPKGQADAKLFANLMNRRDKVNGAIRVVIARQFKEIVDSPELQTAFDELDAATSKLKALENTLEKIDQAISVVDQIIGVVVRIITLAAL